MFGKCYKGTKFQFSVLTIALLMAISGIWLHTYVRASGVKDDFIYTVTDGEAVITDYIGADNSVTIPAALEGYPVTGIAGTAFQDCPELTDVVIPDSVSSIGEGVFAGCSNLRSMTVPFMGASRDDCRYSLGYFFGKDAYAGGVATSQSHYRSGALSIITETYYIPESLKTVVVTGGELLFGAFYNCRNLKSVTIPENVTQLDYSVFYNCSGLVSINIPEGVTRIGGAAFYGCSGLKAVAIPDGVTEIENHVFYGCTGLTAIAIPEGVTGIDDYAFYGCTGLKSVLIPNGVTSIGSSAFRGCTGLTFVSIPKSVAEIDYAAFGCCTGLVSVAIPGSMTKIGSYTFGGCTDLVSVTIGEGVTTILERVFEGCKKLTFVTIPASVTTIGNNAFYNCTNLEDIYYADTATQWSEISIAVGNQNLIDTRIHYSHQHDYSVASAVITPATCTQDGLQESICIFGEFHREILPAFGHAPGTDGITVAPTCTEEGYLQSTCVHCGEQIKTNYLPPLGHDFSLKESVTDPTCTEEGSKIEQCAHCKENLVSSVTELGHSYSGRKVVVEPTCTEQGYTAIQCIRCEEVQKQEYTDALGHNMTVLPGVAPTCTEAGWTVGSHCSRCQLVGIVQQPVEALGHTIKDGVCAICGETNLCKGDFTDDGVVSDADAVYLLRHTLFPEQFSLSGNGDINGDGAVSDADAVYLLRHTLFPNEFPLL